MKSKTLTVALAAALTFAGCGAALAGPFADFEKDLRSVYATYRSALFSTNTKNKDKSIKDVAALTAGWKALAAKWSKAPPPQYAEDPTFAATLAKAQGEIATATAEIAAGDLGKAHLTLEEIRDQLGDLRRRNDISVFSDRMNDYHEEMEKVLTHYKGDVSAAAMPELREQAAILVYLAERLAAAPPADAKDSPEFKKMLEATRASAKALLVAAASGDGDAVKKAVAGIKKPYAMLFLKFG